MKLLLTALVTAGGCYLLICAFYYVLQDRMIFHPQPLAARVTQDPSVQPLALEREDAVLRGWMVNPHHTGPLVFYFGGNAEELSTAIPRFRALPASTVLLNYRAYGASTGQPSERALVDDAREILHTFADPNRATYIIGGSLGSGVAGRVAGPELAGLVLVSPFRNLARVASHHLPWLPVAPLLKHNFDIEANLHAFPQRTLVVLGKRDTIIPPAESRALMARLPASAELIELNAGHNDLWAQPRLWDALRRFLRSPQRF